MPLDPLAQDLMDNLVQKHRTETAEIFLTVSDLAVTQLRILDMQGDAEAVEQIRAKVHALLTEQNDARVARRLAELKETK